MCLGNLFKPPKPPPVQRMASQPALKAPPPPTETPQAEQVKPEGKETGIDNRRKLKAETEKVREGVKQFKAIDPSTMPDSPEGGVTPPI